jgi:multidrug efflux pump subunit AcrA (membrane-fusion protein)
LVNMTGKKPEIIYSEPVREIMGSPPRTILRWGTTIIFAVFILFLLFAWFIKYPDLIPSPVEITTENPPVTLVSKVSGIIKHLYIKDKENVQQNQVLAVMETAASIEEISVLRNFTDTINNADSLKINNIPDLSGLGELQNYYSLFRTSITGLDNFRKNDLYGNKIRTVRQELAGLRIYCNQLKENERLLSENLQLEINRFRRDSTLNAQNTLAQAEYEKSRQGLNKQKIDLQLVRLEISAKEIELNNKEQLINEYSIMSTDELDKLVSAVDESLSNLKAQVKIWENTYLLISPIDGTATFTKFWSENQSVNKDERVLTIVPANPGNYIGRIFLKMQKSGKVTGDEMVNIKLSSFPYLEFGIVRGKVKSKSLVPSGDAYVIEIELPNGLKTLYGRTLDFTQNMQGTAEIITDDKSLLEKMIYPFQYLLSKNKR